MPMPTAIKFPRTAVEYRAVEYRLDTPIRAILRFYPN